MATTGRLLRDLCSPSPKARYQQRDKSRGTDPGKPIPGPRIKCLLARDVKLPAKRNELTGHGRFLPENPAATIAQSE